MRARTLIVLLATLFCVSGCFVLEELEAGEKELDRYSKKPAAASTPPASAMATPSASAKDSPQARLDRWWQSARSLGPRDEESDLVACRIGGTTRFMRSADCQAGGGRLLD